MLYYYNITAPHFTWFISYKINENDNDNNASPPMGVTAIKGHHKISHSFPPPYRLVIAIQLHSRLTMPRLLQTTSPTFMPRSIFSLHSSKPRRLGGSIILPS
jgi:hypothetical protein